MTSFKKLDHRQSSMSMTLQERSKLLAAKPKFGIGQNRVGKENSTCSRVGDTAKTDAGIRVSISTGVKTVNISSRIAFLGKGWESPSQAISKLQTSKRAIKDLKAPSENQRTKVMGLNRESIVTDGRKSLPVLKVNPEEASIPKENAGRNSEGKRGYYDCRGQRNSNVRVLPRNSIMPTLSTLKARESQRTLKSKGASGPNKLVSATATSSKTEKVGTTSLPENVKHEATQESSHLKPTAARLLEDRAEALKAEELPSIDDDCNQLEVSDYVDEIYQYYRVSEVHYKFELMQETLCLVVTLLDQYLSQVSIKKDDMQLVGITALCWHQNMRTFGIQGLNTWFYLIKLCLVDYETLRFKPSLLCATALSVARCTLQITLAWTPLVMKYPKSDCAEMVLRFHKAVRVGSLKVTYEKYSSPDLSGVAAIKPLEMLPLRFSLEG
ncbi:hypothetical protein C1H46_023525 [Malus baccata]|uniref:B-like cyclin n=1 Tax=Malus baccata TaxID=106549 RepID=A0A540LXC9_MALBA|nr:hypothetical protein C1H46_023525 [Malus baccata]